METENDRLMDDLETADDEDRNVANLLITKSERAPTTQPVPNVKANRPTDFVRAAAGTALGALMMAVVYLIARSLLRSPKQES